MCVRKIEEVRRPTTLSMLLFCVQCKYRVFEFLIIRDRSLTSLFLVVPSISSLGS